MGGPDDVGDGQLRVEESGCGEGERTAGGKIEGARADGGHQVGRGGIDLQGASRDDRIDVRAQGRRSAGIITDQQGALVDIPNRCGSIVDREVHCAGAVLIERACAARGDESGRLTRIDVDGAGAGARQDDVDIRRVRGEAEHRNAGVTIKVIADRVVEGNRAEAELAGVRDGDHAVGDDEVGEVVRGGEHQGAGTDLLNVGGARPAEGTPLGEDAAFGDVDVAGSREIKGLGEGEVLLPGAQRAAVHADERIDAEAGGRREGDVARRDHRDTRIGIGVRQAERARAELAQAVIGAVAIRDDTAERHHRAVVLRIGRGRDVDITERTADGVVGKADGAREGEVGRLAVEGAIEIDVAGELDRVADLSSVDEALGAVIRVAADRAVIEDERARTEGRVVAHLDRLAGIEGGEAAVIVGGVEVRRTSPTLHGGGARLDGGGHGAEDDVIGAGQDVGAVEAEDTIAGAVGRAAAEAVGRTGRSRAEAGAGRGRRARGDRADEVAGADLGDAAAVVRVPKGAEEGLAPAERALVDVQVIADRVDGDDGRVRAAGVAVVSRERRHRADVAEADDGEAGLVAIERQSAADVAAGKMEARTGVDRDGARAEGGIRARADVEAGEEALMDGDRTGHRARAGNEGESAVAELLERAGTADRAFQDDGVDAGSRRLGLEPSRLSQRSRTREDETLIDRQHRRVGRAALTGRESQRTKACCAGGRTVDKSGVVEDRDVVKEVGGSRVRSVGVNAAAGKDEGGLVDDVGRTRIGARA